MLPWAPTNAGWKVPDDPVERVTRWPVAVVIALALAGWITPFIPLVAAAGAYGFGDKEQGLILTGTGLMHLVLALTFAAGV